MRRLTLSLMIALAGLAAPAVPILGSVATAQQTPAPAPTSLPVPPPRDCERKPPEIS